MSAPDAIFAGSVPANYDRYMGPLFFEPFARYVARRLSGLRTGAVLETAAGTGIVTAALAATLPPAVSITATDLNQPMLDHAATQTADARIAWQRADALALPFPDGSFDAVVCQFGAMFFPDKAAAYREARRVLRPGGSFLFSVWDRIEENGFADVVTQAVAALFPADPPSFLARTPHGHHDIAALRHDLGAAGFAGIAIETVAARSRAASHRDPAIGYCQGTPLRNEIEARDPARLDEATEAAAAALGSRFGYGAVDGKIQAHVVTASP